MSTQLLGDSPQINLIREWTRGFREQNLDILAKHLHKDYQRITYPRSIGRPVQNKEEWLAFLAELLASATGYEKTIHSVIETPGKVVVHATINLKNSFGVDTSRESIFITQIVTDDDGSLKIKQTEEFTDSKAYLASTQAIKAAKANK